MRKSLLIASIVLGSFLLAFYLFLQLHYLPNHSDSIFSTNEALVLNTATLTIDGQAQTVSLPYVVTDVSPDTVITLSAYFTPPEDCYIYLTTDHTTFDLYVNNALTASYSADLYPNFMQDAPPLSQLFAFEYDTEQAWLQVDYVMPSTVDSLTIDPILLGTSREIFEYLCYSVGFAFMFGLTLIFCGFLLILITCALITVEKRGIGLLWLGLTTMCAGGWLFFDCALTGLLFSNYTLIFFQSLCGMIFFPIPLIYFGMVMIKFHHRTPLYLLSLLQLLSALLGLLLLFWGKLSPATLLEIFNILVPGGLCVFAALILHEDLYYHNKTARNFTYPTILFAIFTVLEMLNSRFNFANMSITFFQIGTAIFIVSMGVLGAFFIRDSMLLQKANQEMELQMELMEYQAILIKKNSLQMMENTELLRKQRHDLRHQLTVIRELSTEESLPQLHEYLDTLIEDIPTSQKAFCANVVVNAILSHFATLCARQEIALSVNVQIDKESQTMPDTDYCILFSNLLENAVEACQYLPPEKRYIRMGSQVRFNTLILTMDNSFDGHYNLKNGRYVSRKRADFGVGLTSVQAVARKHGGDAQFKSDDHEFLSSVYLTID